MTDRVMITQLAKELDVPPYDVSIGVSQLRVVQRGNARTYNRGEALQAMEAYYMRVIKENRQLYVERQKKVYKERAEKYAFRLGKAKAALSEWRLFGGH